MQEKQCLDQRRMTIQNFMQHKGKARQIFFFVWKQLAGVPEGRAGAKK